MHDKQLFPSQTQKSTSGPLAWHSWDVAGAALAHEIAMPLMTLTECSSIDPNPVNPILECR